MNRHRSSVPRFRSATILASVLVVLATAFAIACAKPPSPAETRTDLLAEWEGLKFGMFIHYGMSTFTGQEFGETPAAPAVYAPTSLDVDHWFWVPGDALKSVRTLVRKYQATVLKGANLLLDLAPDKTGRIPEATAARLMEMKAALADPSLIRPSLTFGAKASASNIYKNDLQYAAALALDDDSGTRWASDEGTGECRLEVDLGAERMFDGAFLSEGWDRVREYALEVKSTDGTWKAFHRGTTIGVAGATPAFPRTTGRFVRLHVLKADGAPTFWDFELYEAAADK